MTDLSNYKQLLTEIGANYTESFQSETETHLIVDSIDKGMPEIQIEFFMGKYIQHNIYKLKS